MPKPSYVFMLAFLTCASSLMAATKIKIEDQGNVTVTLSSREHTRIAVKGDRIAQIFGSDERLQVELDEVLGQVFLTPQGELDKSGVRITFITEKGLTQDVQLVVSSQGTDAVILEPVGPVNAKEEVDNPGLTSYEEELTALMESLGGGKAPQGYEFSYLYASTKCDLSPGLCMTPLASLKGAQYQATLFRVENRSEEDTDLRHAHFANIGHVALGLTTQTLKAGGFTFLYAVSAKGESL